MKKIFLSIFLFALFLKNEVRSNEKIAFFIPPEKWEVVNPKGYPSYVVISFVKKEITICRPTLNLATEKTSLTLEQYVNEAKKIHTKDPDASYKILV
ncbi:MAG: hypothetical protein ACE5DL_06295 [Nitrosopumilaceae archaeon]